MIPQIGGKVRPNAKCLEQFGKYFLKKDSIGIVTAIEKSDNQSGYLITVRGLSLMKEFNSSNIWDAAWFELIELSLLDGSDDKEFVESEEKWRLYFG